MRRVSGIRERHDMAAIKDHDLSHLRAIYLAGERADPDTIEWMQDKTGKKYLDFHQKLLSGRGQADKARAMAAAKEAGLDMARLEKTRRQREQMGEEVGARLDLQRRPFSP